MTDEAREAFTERHMDGDWQSLICQLGLLVFRKAWLYDARNALERLGYGFTLRKNYDGEIGVIWWPYRGICHDADTTDAAIEDAVQHWWEEQR